MGTPPQRGTGTEPSTADATAGRGTMLSRVALYFCVAALVYQVVVFSSAGSVMTSNWF